MLTRLSSKPALYQHLDGCYYVSDKGADSVIYIYSSRFSTYAISTYGDKEEEKELAIPNPVILVSPSEFGYDGAPKEPEVTVKDGDEVILPSEYTVVYENNILSGTATVRIVDVPGGKYKVEGEATFVILPPAVTTTELPVETTTEAAPETTTDVVTITPTTEEQTEQTTEGAPAPIQQVSLGKVERPKAKNLKLGIELTWKKVENAKEYQVYRKRQDGKLKKIATTDETTFTDMDTQHGVKYRYFVRAKSYQENGVSYVTGGLSKGRTQYFVKRSGKVKVSKKKATISWTATKEIGGYQLLVSVNKDMKGGKKFDMGATTSISTATLSVPAGTYYIAIRQYLVKNGKKYVSAYHGKRKYVKK